MTPSHYMQSLLRIQRSFAARGIEKSLDEIEQEGLEITDIIREQLLAEGVEISDDPAELADYLHKLDNDGKLLSFLKGLGMCEDED